MTRDEVSRKPSAKTSWRVTFGIKQANVERFDDSGDMERMAATAPVCCTSHVARRRCLRLTRSLQKLVNMAISHRCLCHGHVHRVHRAKHVAAGVRVRMS